MALPLPPILSPQEAAQYGRTLAPYVFSSQILELPSRVIDAANSTDVLHSFQELYLGTNPMLTAIAFALALCPFFVIAAEIRNNYSQVDCWWPILPSIYNLHFYAWAYGNGLPTDRLQTVGVISLLWTVRFPPPLNIRYRRSRLFAPFVLLHIDRDRRRRATMALSASQI